VPCYTISLTNLPDVAANLAITGGNNQSTIVNTNFANPLQVTVTDQFGNLVADGTSLSFASPTTGASTNPVSNLESIAFPQGEPPNAVLICATENLAQSTSPLPICSSSQEN
jgi:hypothetical protein